MRSILTHTSNPIPYTALFHRHHYSDPNWRVLNPQSPFTLCHNFEKYIHRTLNKREKSIITIIERQRLRQSRHNSIPRPILIIDPPGSDSTQLLKDYLDFRIDSSHSLLPSLIFSPSKDSNRPRPSCLSTSFKSASLHRDILQLTYRSYQKCRGFTFAFMLCLNLQDAKSFSPLLTKKHGFISLCRSLFPLQSNWGFLILHIKSSKLSHRHISIISNLPKNIIKLIANKPCKPNPPPADIVTTVIAFPVTLGTISPSHSRITHDTSHPPRR